MRGLLDHRLRKPGRNAGFGEAHPRRQHARLKFHKTKEKRMTNRLKGVFAFVGVIGLAVALSAADEKAPAKKAAGGVLQPQMTPEGGSDPQGKLGEKPAQPWSATTVGAAVDGKPVPGSVTTVTGEIIDFSCYLQL